VRSGGVSEKRKASAETQRILRNAERKKREKRKDLTESTEDTEFTEEKKIWRGWREARRCLSGAASCATTTE
jgi:hypothetical protein